MSGSQNKAVAYQGLVNGAVERFFPLITVRRKSTDSPWINARIRRLVRRRKAIYRRHGRSAAWRRLKNKIIWITSERRKKYEASQKICLLADDGDRHFFKNCKNYQTKDRPTPFDPRSLFPGQSDKEVAETLAEHFNAISQEFSPLEPHQIPRTFSCPLKILMPHTMLLVG